MKSSRWLECIGLTLLCLIFGTAVLAWVMALLGVDVGNVLSSEGLRWLFGHSMRDIPATVVYVPVLALMTWGGISESGLWHDLRSGENVRQMAVVLLLAALMLLPLLCWLLMPGSPMLTATGRVCGSPLALGAASYILCVAIIVCTIYARMTLRIEGFSLTLSFWGRCISIHAVWIPLIMLLIFYIQILKYILR